MILGWGEKTITRYESHQVQDRAHDTILRNIDNNPEWFMRIVEASKDAISAESYRKTHNAVKKLSLSDALMTLECQERISNCIEADNI